MITGDNCQYSEVPSTSRAPSPCVPRGTASHPQVCALSGWAGAAPAQRTHCRAGAWTKACGSEPAPLAPQPTKTKTKQTDRTPEHSLRHLLALGAVAVNQGRQGLQHFHVRPAAALPQSGRRVGQQEIQVRLVNDHLRTEENMHSAKLHKFLSFSDTTLICIELRGASISLVSTSSALKASEA